MKITICILFVFSICLSLQAQTKIFKSYEEYVNGTGKTIDGNYTDWVSGTFGSLIKITKSDGKVEKIHLKEFWGFTNQGYIFRKLGFELAVLVDTGKINFWYNGMAAVRLLPSLKANVTLVGHPDEHSLCYLSVGDINAPIYKMDFLYGQKYFKRFKKDFPDYDDFYDCLEKYLLYNEVRKCVNTYNSNQRKRKR